MCQQCQATLRKGHILIFLVCFSVDVPELMVCVLLVRAGAGCMAEGSCQHAGQSAHCWLAPPVTQRRARCTVQEWERVALQQQRTVPRARACQKAPWSCRSLVSLAPTKGLVPSLHTPSGVEGHPPRGYLGCPFTDSSWPLHVEIL